jgi:hypothetical protein
MTMSFLPTIDPMPKATRRRKAIDGNSLKASAIASMEAP